MRQRVPSWIWIPNQGGDVDGDTYFTTTDELYGERYYAESFGTPYERSNPHWLRFFDRVAAHIVESVAPQTVLDVGCAHGFLVERLRERGVEAYGFDISAYAVGQAHESIKPHVWQASATDELSDRYDLITCIEVLEHLTPDDGASAIANLCAHTDRVLFSSTPDDRTEPTHINVQPPKYWRWHFARNGFSWRQAEFLTPWAIWFERCQNLT